MYEAGSAALTVDCEGTPASQSASKQAAEERQQRVRDKQVDRPTDRHTY